MILSTVSRLAFLSCWLDLMGRDLMGIQPFQTAALISVLMCALSPFLSCFPPTCAHMPVPGRNIQIETNIQIKRVSPSPYMLLPTACILHLTSARQQISLNML